MCEQMTALRQRPEDRLLLRTPIWLVLDDLNRVAKSRAK